MKKLISILFALISFATVAQVLAPKSGGVALRVNDSVTYINSQTSAHSLGYADIFWNNQATTPHMDIWNGSSYTHVFDFNAGGGGGGTWGSITGTLSDQTDLQTALNLKAPLASPTFTGTVTVPTPFTLGATSVTSTGTQLNYLNAATGTTGTTSTNIVFSTSPTLVTPALGTPSALVLTNATGLPGTAVINTPAGTIAATTGQAAINELDDEKENKNATHIIETGNRVLGLTDASKNILMRSVSAQSLTVNPFSSFAAPEGFRVTITPDSTNTITVVEGAGVAIESSSGLLTSACQDCPMVLEKKNASNSWYLWNGGPYGPAALTKVDDTNVTLTLGGSPSVALIDDVSITVGWTGTLASSRGGTGVDNTTQTYTPTLTNTANVSASTARQCTYFRIGNAVTVSGQVDIDPTTTVTQTTLGVSLPIASAFTTAFQCGGGGGHKTVADNALAIDADATNDRAVINYICVDVSNHTITFTFTYQVL